MPLFPAVGAPRQGIKRFPRNGSLYGSGGHPGTWGSSFLLHGRAAA
jgi:hypothetical protein